MSVDLDRISEAFREGLLEALSPLRHKALGLTRNTEKAEDLVQATILRGLEFEGIFDPSSDQLSWLFQIMKNIWFSRGHKSKREIEDPDEVMALQMISHLNPERELIARDLLTFLILLPKEQLQCLALAVKGFDYKDIALRLGVPEGTVKSRISRARQVLLDLMGEPTVPL